MPSPVIVKTSEANRLALDYAVAVIKGLEISVSSRQITYFQFSYTDEEGVSVYNDVPYSPTTDNEDFKSLDLESEFGNSIIDLCSIKEEVLRWFVRKHWGDCFPVPFDLVYSK